MINEELNKSDITKIKSLIKSEFTSKLSDIIEKEVRKIVKDKFNEAEIREVVAETLVKLFRILWYKKNFWQTDVKKK